MSPIEFYIPDGFVSFDGRVVEVWGRTKNTNGRLHLAVIRQVEVGKNHLDIQTIYGSGNLLFRFGDEHRAWVEHLANAIHSAKASLGSAG